MGRKKTPPGYLSVGDVAKLLGCTNPTVYNYERSGQLKRVVPPGRKQGFFIESQVTALANALDNFFETPANNLLTEPENALDARLSFSQASPEDMEGVYEVAASLFSSTTSAAARKPLIEKCPQGNYIVKKNETIVAYIHIQPLKHDRMMAFMKGEIRGKDIKADDLECFTNEKPIEVLVKSVGAIKSEGTNDAERLHNQRYLLMRLLRGTARELEKLGAEGVEIKYIYATSETLTGIRMAYDAKMDYFGKPLGETRFRYILDISKSNLALLQPYKRALADWKSKKVTV